MGDSSTAPRKRPKQERSRATVERILAAGQRCLAEHGYEGTSTNRIADAAGISPGSLYQYFPNKDAVVVAVIDRFTDALTAQIARDLAARLDQPPAQAVRTTIESLLDALDVHPEFVRVAFEQTERLQYGRKLAAFEHRIEELTTAYLLLHGDRSRSAAEREAAVWIGVRAVGDLTVRYALERPEISREDFLSAFTRLVLAYFPE